MPEISLPAGRNSDRCDLIASLHPPPAALRLFAYRLRLAHSKAPDCRSRKARKNRIRRAKTKKTRAMRRSFRFGSPSVACNCTDIERSSSNSATPCITLTWNSKAVPSLQVCRFRAANIARQAAKRNELRSHQAVHLTMPLHRAQYEKSQNEKDPRYAQVFSFWLPLLDLNQRHPD